MLPRLFTAVAAIVWLLTAWAYAQTPSSSATGPVSNASTGWRNSATRDVQTASQTSASNVAQDARRTAGNEDHAPGDRRPARSDPSHLPSAATGVDPGDRPSLTRVSKGTGTLPNDHGQVWREYDISPYTVRVTSTRRPEQAIVDWILRETGYEEWHSETVTILSADHRTLRVYHTPEMQRLVSEIVDRFVNSQAESHGFELRVVTVGSPNWRSNLLHVLKPIPVQSQGVQGWLLAKEDAALLLAQLSKRSDFREYTLPQLIVHNGQSAVVGTSRPRKYVKSILSRPGFPGFEPEIGQLDEGYSLEFSPLLSVDGTMIDAVIKCQVNQVEKMIPVTVDVPTQLASHQRQQIEVPQMTSCDLHERFRWPVDHVLLISRGVVATPMPQSNNPLQIPISLATGTGSRADALVFIQSRGRVAPRAAALPVR